MNQSRLQSQYGDQILNLSSNSLTKGLVTLEGILKFDDQMKSKALNLATNKDDHILVTVVEGRALNLRKVCFKI